VTLINVMSEFDPSGILGIGALVVGAPFYLGITMFSLSLSRNEKANISEIFEGFNRFGTALFAGIITGIIVVVGVILIIIPGIVAGLAISQTYLIIADNSGTGAWDAVKRSNELMKGNKWKMFCLWLRLLLWFIPVILTLGIGFFWYMPYASVCLAKFYDDIINIGPSEIDDVESISEPNVDSEVVDFSPEETVVQQSPDRSSGNPMPISLNVENGPRSGSFYAVSKQTRIGRAPDNDIVLNANTVSSYHAEIFVKNGQFHIKDMDSTNGTKVDGERVSESPLELGTKLKIGETELTVE